MEDEKQVEHDRQRAEVFDALGHPTRIQILKVLSEGSLGFADLKKKTSIESSGHLQHHLGKLNGLIKTDEYGKYCLSDEGKDALLTVQTVESTLSKKEVKRKGHKQFRLTLKPVAFLLATLLIVSSLIAVYEYNQAADNQAALLREKFTKADEFAGAYIDQSNTLHIILTNNATTTTINHYRNMMENGTNIVFETATFPLSHLYAVQDALDGVMIKFGIEATGINEIANTIDINLLDSTKQKDVIEFLKTVFNDFDDRCVAFMGPIGIRLTYQNYSVNQQQKDFTGYYYEFGNVSLQSISYNFSPPISMYHALKTALDSDGWNTTTLENMTVRVSLDYFKFTIDSTITKSPYDNTTLGPSWGYERLYSVTQPVKDYSAVTINNATYSTTYRYIWDIVVKQNTGVTLPPPGFYWVDAATAEIIPFQGHLF